MNTARTGTQQQGAAKTYQSERRRKVGPRDGEDRGTEKNILDSKPTLKTSRSSLRRKMGMLTSDTTLGNATAHACELLGLTSKDIKRLNRKFNIADEDGSGQIERKEFFKLIKEDPTEFSNALFSLIDTDGSGGINFDEFVRVLTTYCIYSQSDILYFIYQHFDTDGSGVIEEGEFIDMCTRINAHSQFPGNLVKAFQSFDCNDDGLIDFDEFKELNRRYPLLLYPAFLLQDRMQACTLGTKRWTKALKHKAKRERIEQYKAAHDGEMPPEGRSRGCFGFLRRA